MSELKYKVGDKVRINSIEWYNENKDWTGHVPVPCLFRKEMSEYCGQIMTIRHINSASYFLEGVNFFWSDEMFEGLVEEKTKPKFKVGDKVKDKNNRVWFIVRVSETFFDISSVPNAQGYFVPIDNQDDYELVP